MANKSNMTFQIKVDNTGKVGQELEEAIKRALEICGGKAETYAKENLKVNKSIVTGRLRASITHQLEDNNRTVAIGSSVEYAPFVELGHHQTPGRYVKAIGKRLKASFVQGKPYLRPAIENHLSEYKNIIEAELHR